MIIPYEQTLLNALYSNEWRVARNTFDEAALAKLSYPFMLHATMQYLAAPVRVMFVGKETNGWLEKLGKLKVFYSDAHVGVDRCVARHNWQYEEGSWNTPFLRMLTKVADELQLPGKESVLWNNLLKCDWDRGRTDSRVAIGRSAALQFVSARIFRAEVEILRPDFIFFACGAKYDGLIKACMPHREDSVAHEARALWTFRSGKTMCIRLRHPGARRSVNFDGTANYYARALRAVQVARNVPANERRWVFDDEPLLALQTASA